MAWAPQAQLLHQATVGQNEPLTHLEAPLRGLWGSPGLGSLVGAARGQRRSSV